MGKKNISYRLGDLKNVMIPLGFMGENLYTRLIIDATEVYKDNPNAVVSLAVSPPRGDKYPAVVTRDGNNVIWDVSASDLIYDGNGEIQFTFTDSPMVRKSYKARISVNNSIFPDGTVPTPIENFLTQASEALTACGEATTAAENAASKQPKIIEDYWYVWDAETEQYVTTGINAHGDAGHTPVITGDKTGKTSKIYSDGVQIAAIQDGEDGSPGDPTLIIDDTSTGLDKTWSASKQQELKSALNAKYTKPASGIPATDIAAGVIPYVTPEMYGAKGDGETDDSAAISSMFNVYSPVYVMNGDYICDSEIKIQNKKDIIITGTGSIYKHSTASNSRLFDFLECENIHVEGITLKSTNDKTPDSPGDHSVRTGALLSNVQAFVIDNSSFITFSKVKFIQIGYCFSVGTWNTTSSEEKYRTKNICMNGITMENCGMGIYCQNLSDLSITDWIFDDMAISPGGYHMFYGSTALKNINLINLAFNGNQYSDDVILVESADQETGASGDSNIIVENITAECSHFASTEPNTLMVIKNGIIAMHNHYSEDMYSGNSSVVMTYYASNNAPNVVFENCIIYHVDGTDKPLIAMSEMNVNLQFINCDIRLNIGAYSVHNVMFHNCKMTGRRLVNTSLNTNFATNVTFKDCDVVAQGYSVLFNTTGKLILDNCRFKTNHTRVIHSTAQAGSIFAYNNIADSSSGSCVFGLDSTYLTDYRDLNNTVYTNSQ